MNSELWCCVAHELRFMSGVNRTGLDRGNANADDFGGHVQLAGRDVFVSACAPAWANYDWVLNSLTVDGERNIPADVCDAAVAWLHTRRIEKAARAALSDIVSYYGGAVTPDNCRQIAAEYAVKSREKLYILRDELVPEVEAALLPMVEKMAAVPVVPGNEMAEEAAHLSELDYYAVDGRVEYHKLFHGRPPGFGHAFDRPANAQAWAAGVI